LAKPRIALHKDVPAMSTQRMPIPKPAPSAIVFWGGREAMCDSPYQIERGIYRRTDGLGKTVRSMCVRRMQG
jgi:hypothetical protein